MRWYGHRLTLPVHRHILRSVECSARDLTRTKFDFICLTSTAVSGRLGKHQSWLSEWPTQISGFNFLFLLVTFSWEFIKKKFSCWSGPQQSNFCWRLCVCVCAWASNLNFDRNAITGQQEPNEEAFSFVHPPPQTHTTDEFYLVCVNIPQTPAILLTFLLLWIWKSIKKF